MSPKVFLSRTLAFSQKRRGSSCSIARIYFSFQFYMIYLACSRAKRHIVACPAHFFLDWSLKKRLKLGSERRLPHFFGCIPGSGFELASSLMFVSSLSHMCPNFSKSPIPDISHVLIRGRRQWLLNKNEFLGQRPTETVKKCHDSSCKCGFQLADGDEPMRFFRSMRGK